MKIINNQSDVVLQKMVDRRRYVIDLIFSIGIKGF